MGGVTGPAPLAPFADDWVGGDIHGLSALAGTLYGYVPSITDVASALDSQVRNMVGAAGWQGSAASAFSAAWGKDSQAARAVGIAADQIAGIVDWLAVRLSQIESELEKYAAEAHAHGVPIGADGMPPQACYGPPSNAQQAQQQGWATWYQETWQNCMTAAKAARAQAAAALGQMSQAITGQDGMTASDGNSVADLLGDLLAVPSAYSRDVADELAGIRTTARSVIGQAKGLQAGGERLPASLLDEIQTSRSELTSGDAALVAARSNETMLSKLLDVRAGDVLSGLRGSSADVSAPPLDPGAGADGGGALDSLVNFGEKIPVIDLLAGAVGTGLGTASDTAAGQPLYTALPEETVSNFGGVAAGYAAGSAVGSSVGGAVGTAVGSGIAGGVVGGVLGAGVGGVVAYGVGDFAHNLFQQNWSADINSHGVVGGVAYGIADSAVNTGKDFVHTATDIGHAAENLWNSVF
jgi:uncharacterized protein YukE